MSEEQIDVADLIAEYAAQRNMIADQLARAGALIVTLRKRIAKLEKPKEEQKE